MMTFKTGNLLRDEAPVLVNTVNLVGVMGKGIALAFKQAFPKNFAAYAQACKRQELAIGSLLIVEDDSILYGRKTIINLPTKVHWRQTSQYRYIQEGLCALRNYLLQTRSEGIAMPALGCGNGNLDWQVVRAMIADSLGDLDTDITVYTPI